MLVMILEAVLHHPTYDRVAWRPVPGTHAVLQVQTTLGTRARVVWPLLIACEAAAEQATEPKREQFRGMNAPQELFKLCTSLPLAAECSAILQETSR